MPKRSPAPSLKTEKSARSLRLVSLVASTSRFMPSSRGAPSVPSRGNPSAVSQAESSPMPARPEQPPPLSKGKGRAPDTEPLDRPKDSFSETCGHCPTHNNTTLPGDDQSRLRSTSKWDNVVSNRLPDHDDDVSEADFMCQSCSTEYAVYVEAAENVQLGKDGDSSVKSHPKDNPWEEPSTWHLELGAESRMASSSTSEKGQTAQNSRTTLQQQLVNLVPRTHDPYGPCFHPSKGAHTFLPKFATTVHQSIIAGTPLCIHLSSLCPSCIVYR